jgi:hypothetical protein
MTSLPRLALLSSLVLACRTEPPPAAADDETKTPPPEPLPEVSTANPPLDEPPKPVAPHDGFFMAEGAPLPRACKVASDCHGNTIPDLANPCCQDPRSLEAYATAYRNWLGGWRKDNCASVTCPPPPAPSEPPACAFDVDCVEGSCVDACD